MYIFFLVISVINLMIMACNSNGQQASPVKIMQLNDQKAGMQGLDKDAINKVIYEASKGTPYFTFQEKKQQRIDKRVQGLLEDLKSITEHQKRESMKKVDIIASELEAKRNLNHSIVHIDMDAFYAAVEMLDDPKLKTKPMAVGSQSMLSTSNYEARKYGVRAAMPGFIGKKLCPELIIIPPHFDKYKKISKQVRNIIEHYDPNYTAMSLDEMYFDLTDYIFQQCRLKRHQEYCSQNLSPCLSSDEIEDEVIPETKNFTKNVQHCTACCGPISNSERDKLAYEIVEEIRQKIVNVTQLTASAGIAPNTMLAKVCSDQNKPNGQFQIKSNLDDVKNFIKTLPVRKISGIGPVQSQLFSGIGIETCGDLWTKRDIVALLFSQTSSEFYLEVALGLGNTVIKNDHVRKSIGVEVTFKEMSNPVELHQKCEELCDEMIDDLKSRNLVGKVVVLKFKTVNFESHTRNATLITYTSDRDIIVKAAKRLLDHEISSSPYPLKLRLMGMRMANLLEENDAVDEKQAKLKDFLKPQTSVTPSLPTNSPVKTVTSITEEKCGANVSNDIVEDDDIESPISNHELICPVCGFEQNVRELFELNSHIDNCLSKKAIKEILAAEITPVNLSEKRKKSCSKPNKKLKIAEKPVRKISQYFH